MGNGQVDEYVWWNTSKETNDKGLSKAVVVLNHKGAKETDDKCIEMAQHKIYLFCIHFLMLYATAQGAEHVSIILTKSWLTVIDAVLM